MSDKQTFAIIKPGAVRNGFIGGIITEIERTGLKIAKIRMIVPPRSHLEAHYCKDREWFEMVGNKEIEQLKANGIKPQKSAIQYGYDALDKVIQHMASGPMVIMVVTGKDAIEALKKITGQIRDRFGIDIVDNALHRSDSEESADNEIALWDKYF